MLLTNILGTALISCSILGLYQNSNRIVFKRRLKRSFEGYGLTKLPEREVVVRKFRKTDYGYYVEIDLPAGISISRLRQDLSGIGQYVSAEIQLKQIKGSICALECGTHPLLDEMNYHDDLPIKYLSVPLFTHYGEYAIDFEDETNCHLLIGGTTRMGKTAFLRYLVTHLIRTTNGDIKVFFIDNKITDLYMFQNIPQVEIAETEDTVTLILNSVLHMAKERKAKLHAKCNVVDIKQFRKEYPDEPMKPIFVVIDEYGRYADNKEIQSKVMEIAETAGYLDIHLVVATQRPDVQTVLRPRIRANMLTRMSFTTADEANSNLTLGVPDAYHLDGIQGRAILFDGRYHKVQVPYLSPEQATVLLQSYYRKEVALVDETRQEDNSVAETLPSFVTGPVGYSDLQ